MKFFEYAANKKIDKNLLDVYGRYRLYLVNGETVRGLSKEANEFTDYGLHYNFPKIIPENEIWFDDITKKDELFFLIATAIYEQKLRDKGVKNAYSKSLEYDKKLREIIDGPASPEKTNSPPPKKVYEKLYGIIKDEKISIWLVNGKIIRDLFKTDFIEGGNGYVYSWIPNDEIWIEDTIDTSEIPEVIIHEFVERTLMKYQNMSYTKAHPIASKVDFRYYEDGLSKKEVLELTKEKALKLAEKEM